MKFLEQLQKKLNEIRSKASRLKDNGHDANTANAASTSNATESPLQPKVAFGENLNFRFASAAIELKKNSLKGRHVVANRDIEKGQILFVEKAFTFVPLNQDEINHVCHNCCRSITRNVSAP